jgi:hypothetical protein
VFPSIEALNARAGVLQMTQTAGNPRDPFSPGVLVAASTGAQQAAILIHDAKLKTLASGQTALLHTALVLSGGEGEATGGSSPRVKIRTRKKCLRAVHTWSNQSIHTRNIRASGDRYCLVRETRSANHKHERPMRTSTSPVSLGWGPGLSGALTTQVKVLSLQL